MLTPRLLALSRQVPRGARFADVGTDHARLPVWLLEQGVPPICGRGPCSGRARRLPGTA